MSSGADIVFRDADHVEGLGWISQFQLAGDLGWLSWTQWKRREDAERHVAAFLRNHRDRYVAGRIVRVDWTIVATFPAEPPDVPPGLTSADMAELDPPPEEANGGA